MMDVATIAARLAPFLGSAALGPAPLSQLALYLDLLRRWNARMNLTAVRDPEQMITRHFGESLFAARHLYSQPAPRNCLLIDIGSGAGFPGLPIKIWAPALHLTLLESNHRKSAFLREVVRALQLSEVEVVCARAEDYVAKIAPYRSPIPRARDETVASESIANEKHEGIANETTENERTENERTENGRTENGSIKVGPGAPAGAAPNFSEFVAAAGAPPAPHLTITLRAVEHFATILPTSVRLLQAFPTSTRRLALLIGEAQVKTARQMAAALSWSGPLPIPQSSRRVLLIGA